MTFNVVRDLTAEDLFQLLSEPITASAPPTLQKITSNHHAMARLIASGKSSQQVAILCNRTPQRIRDLTRDPAFKELVSFYENQISDAEINDEVRLRNKLVTVAETAVDEIEERLDDPERRAKIPVSELRQIATMGLDRTVAPPKTAIPMNTAPQNITFNIAGNGPARDIKTIESVKIIEHQGEKEHEGDI